MPNNKLARNLSICGALRRFIRRGASRAFSLIELLIVVAILAILAAIATPNFLEAQTRAKISRAHADIRTITAAIECYRVDYPRYPLAATYCAAQMDAIDSYNHLASGITTPVAYLTSTPRDVFNRNQTYKYIAPGLGWANGSQTILTLWVPKGFPGDGGLDQDVPHFSEKSPPVKWALWSVGPRGALSRFRE